MHPRCSWRASMKLRDAHFYRRVPADVSEATKTGGVISLVAMATIVWLVLTQYQEYHQVRHETELRLDGTSRAYGGASTIRINFNISMLHVPCQYASVHVADHVGSHKMGGSRNVHRVRLGQDGASLGMFEPHKYSGGAKLDESMANHVFPWHKKEHTQGDKEHNAIVSSAHLSPDQKHVVGKVEDKIRTAGKAQHVGRKLLFGEHAEAHAGQAAHTGGAAAPVGAAPAAGAPAGGAAPAASDTPAASAAGTTGEGEGAATPADAPHTPGTGEKPATQSPAPSPAVSPPSVPPPEGRPGPQPAPDSSSSCKSWAGHGECVSNPGFMLSSCETSCAPLANADQCAKWGSQEWGLPGVGQPGAGACHDAASFMGRFCAGTCGPALPAAASPHATATPHAAASAHAEAAPADAAARVVEPVELVVEDVLVGEDEPGGRFLPARPYNDAPADINLVQFEEMLHSNVRSPPPPPPPLPKGHDPLPAAWPSPHLLREPTGVGAGRLGVGD